MIRDPFADNRKSIAFFMPKKTAPEPKLEPTTATPAKSEAATGPTQPESAKDKRVKLKGRAALIAAFNILLFNLSLAPEADAQIQQLLKQAEKAE